MATSPGASTSRSSRSSFNFATSFHATMAKGKRKAAASGPKPARRQQQAPAKPEPRNAYETVGRDLGSIVGFGDVGERLGGAVSKLFGRGDYTLHTNSLISSYGMPAAGPSPPSFAKDGKRGVRVIEREYLGDIVSGTLSGASTVFTSASYLINPGDATTFPWLSRIARLFDQWEPHGIVFEYRATSSEYNGTSQALGVVALATDYDVKDAPYASKAELENADYSMSVKSSSSAVHGIECDPAERPTQVLYCGAAPSGGDARMHDLGRFQIATQGMSAAGVTLGELWVAYDITFYKKQLSSNPSSTDLIEYGSYATSGISGSDLFGYADSSFRAYGTLNSYPLFSATRVYFPPSMASGRFLVRFYWTGTGGTGTVPSVAYTNCVEASTAAVTNGGVRGFRGTITGVGAGQLLELVVDVVSPSAYLTLSGGSLPAGTNQASCRVTQVVSNTLYDQPVA